jgi:hypothetical protein
MTAPPKFLHEKYLNPVYSLPGTDIAVFKLLSETPRAFLNHISEKQGNKGTCAKSDSGGKQGEIFG